MAKIEPAVTQLLYLVPDGTSYVDLAKDLSKVNRRLYRQGYTYVVQDVQVILPVGSRTSDIQYMQVSTSGNSWVVHNAWTKGYRAWRAQQREMTAALGTAAEGSYADFKIYLDDSHEDATTLEPYAGDAAVYQAGEWEYSKLVFDDDGSEKELKMHIIGSSNLGDTNNESGIGLINEYQNSRVSVPSVGMPHVPTGASDSIYAKLMGTDELSDMLIDNIENDNDTPPYDYDDYPGGAVNADVAVPVRWLTVTGSQGMTVGAGFIAPCGLIKLDTLEFAIDSVDVNQSLSTVYAEAAAPTLLIMVTVAAGPYRGVLAAPMGQ